MPKQIHLRHIRKRLIAKLSKRHVVRLRKIADLGLKPTKPKPVPDLRLLVFPAKSNASILVGLKSTLGMLLPILKSTAATGFCSSASSVSNT